MGSINTVKADNDQKGSEIVLYYLKLSQFENFIENPKSFDFADITAYTYKKSKKDGYIDCAWKENTGEISSTTKLSGFMRTKTGDRLFYTEFIEFVGSAKAVQKYLSDNGIETDVKNCVLINCTCTNSADIPLVLWVQTSGEGYFIAIKVDRENYITNVADYYTYTIYTVSDFYNEYKLNDGILKVNNKDITNGNYIKFQKHTFYASFSAIIEALGGKVDWDKEQENFSFTYNGKQYFWRFSIDGGLYEIIDDSIENIKAFDPYGNPLNKEPMIFEMNGKIVAEIIEGVQGGSWEYQEIIDDIMIMDDRTLRGIFSALGISMDVNYDDLTVEISDKNSNVIPEPDPEPKPDFISVTIDGKPVSFDVEPVMENSRILVPLRAIFEAMGASVKWNEDTQTVTAEKDGTKVSMQIGSNKMVKNGETITLDVPPQLINNRTLVPVRAIAESFGAKVDWDEVTKTVLITQ